MKVSALTCTYRRPEALELSRRYMGRQSRQPDQWLILDGPEPMAQKVFSAVREGKVEGDVLLFWEDDDYYKRGWIEWCERKLAQGFDIAGQGNALYYNVRQRWWSHCANVRHASLCQSAIHRSLFEGLLNVIVALDNPFFDTRLWRLEARRYLDLPKPGQELVYGIKGMPGTAGYSTEHRKANMHEVHPDPSLLKLFQLLGDDASAYAKFSKR